MPVTNWHRSNRPLLTRSAQNCHFINCKTVILFICNFAHYTQFLTFWIFTGGHCYHFAFPEQRMNEEVANAQRTEDIYLVKSNQWSIINAAF